MRRLIAGAALFGLVLAGAACGTDEDTTATPSPTATVDVAANTKEVCAAVEKTTNDSVEKFTKEVTTKITQAAAQGGDAQQAAVDLVKQWMGDWADSIRDEADKAADPELKSSLTALAGEIDNGAADVNSFDDLDKMDEIMDSPEMDQIGKDVEKFCPNLS